MTAHEHYPDTHHDVSSNTIFGFWLYLMTDFVLFASLFAVYAVLKDNTYGGPTSKDIFNLSYAFSETVVLLTSSFTCGLATLAAMKRQRNRVLFWYGATFLLGLVFLSMQLGEFASLVREGASWQRSAFLSAYFTLIGTHGLHIAGGLLFILVFMAEAWQRGLTPVVIRRLSCMKLFWQFSYVVWIFMFAFVYLMGV